MDGCFVPNISMGIPVLASTRACTDMFIDVHLMIEKPVRYVRQFCEAGADLVNVHVEADTEENIHEALSLIRALGKKTGITLKPKTPWEAALPFMEEADLILIMTVEPGFGGQHFMPEQMPKLQALRDLPLRKERGILLEVDGGVDRKTAGICVSSGADVLVAGSAVFREKDRRSIISALRG